MSCPEKENHIIIWPNFTELAHGWVCS